MAPSLPSLVAFLACATLVSAYQPQYAHRHSPSAGVARVRSAAVRAKLDEVDRQSWCEEVEGAEGLSVVFFYAPWCRNCKAVRPRLERIQRKYSDQEVNFFQVNFKTETKLCYEQRVFNFPTVHFYLPGIGRVARAVLTASDTESKMKSTLDRVLSGRPQLQQLTAQAVSPMIQYVELVSALQGIAELAAPPSSEGGGGGGEGFGSGVDPKKESIRLRSMVKGDEQRLAELEALFNSLDADADGRLQFGELQSAVDALQPVGSDGGSSGNSVTSELLERLSSQTPAGKPLSVDQSTFLSLMVDKAVADFADGEKALLPAFQTLDVDGDGVVTQEQLIEVMDNFCGAHPDADGCSVDAGPRNLQLANAFAAFANDDALLDYERFVEMVSGRTDGFGDECEIYDDDALAATPLTPKQLAELDPMMGERECFGEAVTDEGDDDFACDAWFFGEDPTKKKEQVVSDPAKIAALREAGAAMHAERQKRDAQMAAFLQRNKGNM